MKDLDWWNRANCIGVDVNLFFDQGRYNTALKYCANCPVVKECGIANDREEHTDIPYGIVAGQTVKERLAKRGYKPRKHYR